MLAWPIGLSPWSQHRPRPRAHPGYFSCLPFPTHCITHHDIVQDELYADFPIKFKLADTSGSFPLSVGDKLYIPTMQHCTNNTFRDWVSS